MATALFSSTRSGLRLGASATSKGLAGMTFARGKATLSDLSCKLEDFLRSGSFV